MPRSRWPLSSSFAVSPACAWAERTSRRTSTGASGGAAACPRGPETFNMSFQIGMLASFESFLETPRLKRTDDEADANFDDAEQTAHVRDDALRLAAREGIDVRDVNRLTRHYKDTFGTEMPHPKMDALVTSLMPSRTTGRKALVFVRRGKSVDELKRKLDEQYDVWLVQGLRERLAGAAFA